MLKKSCYILAFVLSFIKIDPVFSMEDEISSCIDEDWEKNILIPMSSRKMLKNAHQLPLN